MRSRTSPRLLAALTLAAPLTLATMGCSNGSAAPAAEGDNAFPAVTTFDYQLGEAYEPLRDVQLVVRDRTAPPAASTYSVCYINAYQTQPGDLDRWPTEALLSVGGTPVTDPDWPDETLLDTSTDDKRSAIMSVVEPWIARCADDGFDAVEFDNLDSFTRSQDALTLADNLALASSLADAAHRHGLAAGQKNAAEHASRIRDEAGFDFAVAEECAAYDECAEYTGSYGDAVIDIEYTDTLPRTFAEMCADPDSPAAMILRDRDLLAPDDDGFTMETCGTI